MIGSIVSDAAILLPALNAVLVIFCKAVIPIICNAENLALTVSTPLPKVDISTFLEASLTSVNPLVAPVKLSFSFNLSNVLNVVAAFFSNFLLSNSIDTTRSSIVVLIVY